MIGVKAPRVVVIGAGSTGCAIAHDLALRGLYVTLVERAGVASGTTGHNQAQLHSGARYAVNDPESARECIEENRILRLIMPEVLELNDGLFVAICEEHMDYRSHFIKACEACGIPTEEVPVVTALKMEPWLNPLTIAAIRIPDGVFDPYRFCLSFLATAQKNGAQIMTFAEVEGIDLNKGFVRVRSRVSKEIRDLPADVVINAAGPWAGKVACLAGVEVKLEASAGVMVTIGERLCNMVLNLLVPPGDGDIIVPQRRTSILGTTSWEVEDADDIPIPPGHVEEIMKIAEQLIPAVRKIPLKGVMASARALVLTDEGGRGASRKSAIFEHSDLEKAGFFSIIGGKTTTARGMAETLSDKVSARLSIQANCRTRSEKLASYRKATLDWRFPE